MFPSKADRILSRYRPIAPKLPLPLPPPSASLVTDLSSTCASLDSFASSAKIRRTRKRRLVPATLSAARCLKTRKSEKPPASALSNNNTGLSTSSLTQGNSDGAVPRIDVSYTSSSYGVHEKGTIPTQNVSMDVSDRSRVALRDPSMVAPHFHPQNLVEQARMFMMVDALKSRQPSLSPPLHLRGFPASEMMDKDVAFMERAAASSVLPEKGAPAGLACSSMCMKGAGNAGGGFTEMIRGITRLPTVADVQSLMQARSGTAGGVAVLSPGMSSPTTAESRRTSLTQREVYHQPPELQSPPFQPSPTACQLIQAASSCQGDGCTRPLLPNYPSKHPLPPAGLADPPVYRGALSTEVPKDHKTLSQNEGPAVHLSLSNCPDKLLSGQSSAGKQPHQDTNDADALFRSPPSCSENLRGSITGPPSDARARSQDCAAVDHAYLQQVYGGSTDPILLVDANSQVLWFNKAYERAFKSVVDRISRQPAATGPYIDPLGHPTPLGSLVLNHADGVSRPVNATLWGFLRKLVMPNVDTTPNLLRSAKLQGNRKDKLCDDKPCDDNDKGRLCLSLGGIGPDSISEDCSYSLPKRRIDDANDTQVCVNMGKLTTVTLESITEVHMGQGAPAMECVETVEARLGASGSGPAFITDCTSRVRWVNTAFKQMLGQSELQSSSMVTSAHPIELTIMQNEPPELTFVGAAEKIPWSAWAFSGLVNLEWLKAGKRRSMTVPCDVSRLAPAATWVWKFDLALGLSLNLCA